MILLVKIIRLGCLVFNIFFICLRVIFEVGLLYLKCILVNWIILNLLFLLNCKMVFWVVLLFIVMKENKMVNKVLRIFFILCMFRR